jgi:LuxR family maltose regulon positive regulatory protein
MSAAGILDTIYTEYADLVPMDPWIDVLAKLLGGNPVFPSDEFELRAYQSFVGTVYRAPRNPLLKSCVERVEALLKQPFDVNLKVVAGQRLGAYADATTDVELSRRVSEAITPLLDSVELTPANAALFLNMKGYDLYIAWKIDDALACFARAKAIARREGLANEEFRTGVYQAICERRTGRLAAAQRTISELETMPRPERGALLSIYEILKALIAYSRGDIKLAVAAAQESLHLGTTFGNVFIEVIVCVFNAQFLIVAGDLKSASSLLKRSRLLASGSAIDNARAYIALNEAHVAHLLGDTAQREQRLREALEFARTASGRARQRWFPEAMSALFPVALKEGIEPDLVRSLIREFDLSPESRDVEGWPWPVKLYTLGRFRALLDNRPLEFSRKSPKKTMTLLKALIAFGGKKVSEQKLIDALWPNEDGDDAHHAFNSALHRLRKLLGDKDLIGQSGGAISLDEHRCWIDAVAFEGLLAGVALNGAELGEASLDNLSRSITLYTGNFLQNEEDAPWAVSFRERLRARFVQAVNCYAQQLEKSGRTKEAIDCYLTGLEADDLVEPFYQGLMRCYDKINRRSEAIGVYRRMRQTLSVTLGIRPSAASEGLYQSLQGG